MLPSSTIHKLVVLKANLTLDGTTPPGTLVAAAIGMKERGTHLTIKNASQAATSTLVEIAKILGTQLTIED
jgi:hypothetical protein